MSFMKDDFKLYIKDMLDEAYNKTHPFKRIKDGHHRARKYNALYIWNIEKL